MVVQQPRGTSPPRPAPRPSEGNQDNSLRNGYAAISHSVSGEAAAIGLGFAAAGPFGAILGGATLPVLVAVSMWRARRAEHDADTNSAANAAGDDRNRNGGRDRSGDRGGRGNGNGNGNGAGGGRHRSPNGPNGPGGGRKTPKGPDNGASGPGRKPKVKDPVADKLGKAGKSLADKLKNRDKNNPHKTDKNGKSGKDTADGSGKTPKTPKDGGGKGLKDGLRNGLKIKDRGKQPGSDRPWRERDDKPEKTKKDRKKKGSDGDVSSATARAGIEPKAPKGGGGAHDEIFDAEIVDDGLPPKPARAPREVIDGEVIDEDRIGLVRAKREKAARRAAIKVGKKAAADAARDGTHGDPHTVKVERIRTENQWIDLELHRENQLLALAAGTENRRRTPVTYPVATTAAAGTRTAGVAVARQIDPRVSTAYRLLVAMAEQLANGLHHDDDADMADHVVELVGIPALCRNLSTAVRTAAAALQKTAPLHPSVIKHLNNAAIAAATAGAMADSILVVFVQAHREDIFRVISPRVGEERWNIRNAEGTLDGAKLRAAIMSAGQKRLALPAGSSAGGGTGKVVPASHDSTKKLISLMKDFDRGHMVVCLSEIAGSASGVEVVANSITKLYRRMAKSWPTENVVDDTVRATASKVRTIADELRKAIKAAQRAHARELRLNAKPRKGARAEKKWDVVKGRRG